MNDCIFTGHCMNYRCDRSCPMLVQTGYLLERNNLSLNNPVFNSDPKSIESCMKLIDNRKGKLSVVIDKHNTSKHADLLTYCSICKYWKGSQLHSVVYHLKYSRYIDLIQKSWSSHDSEELDYMQIWARQSKVLIISGIDFVNFKTFQCQSLLELLQSRSSDPDNTTIIVSPALSSLVGEGGFFGRLLEILRGAVVQS